VFDFGWQEFMMIAFVLVLVVGPKDLPKVLRSFTKITGQVRKMAREFSTSLEDVAGEADVKGVKQMVADLKTGNLEDMARVVDDKILTDTQVAGNSADLSEIKENIQAVQDAAKTLSDAQADVTNTETPSSQQDKA
jgi:sec-independent protein translocase protein TatB